MDQRDQFLCLSKIEKCFVSDEGDVTSVIDDVSMGR